MAHSFPAEGVIALDIGPWFTRQAQSLWRVDRRNRRRLAVDQPMQKVQDMGLGGNPRLKRHLDCAQDSLFVVMKNQCEDLNHLPIAAGASGQQCL